MIALSAQRAAHRRQTENFISARPLPARFRTLALPVRANEPVKTRELRVGGFVSDIALECQLVLPIGTPRPQEEKELIDIQDEAGDYRTYSIASVTPLHGHGCFRLGLRSRNKAPTRTAPPIVRA